MMFNPLGRGLGAPIAGASGRLRKLDQFGSNPGNLGAWAFVPEHTNPIGLVVVLHGCTQTAQGYESGSGWSELAEAYGFAVLFPEQRRSNNPNLCFNWFDRAHTRRGQGEVHSIAQMIDTVIEQNQIDADRVFITGLSAGGAMTSAMLALYPEKFAGGAILAGLPHGAAGSVQEAFQQMRAHTPANRTTGSAIHAASGHAGIWPTVSIWHGTADTVVDQSNADAILRQWLEIHDLPDVPSETGLVDTYPHRVWRDTSGKALIEEYRVTGMGHGTPLSTKGECGCGEAGAFMLEVGISSTVHSAKSWGLLGQRITPTARAEQIQPAEPKRVLLGRSSISDTIEAALRQAGLMK